MENLAATQQTTVWARYIIGGSVVCRVDGTVQRKRGKIFNVRHVVQQLGKMNKI